MADFIGEKGCGPTHHHACECREREFEAILAERDELRREVERLKKRNVSWLADPANASYYADECLKDYKEAAAQLDRLRARIELADRLAEAVEVYREEMDHQGTSSRAGMRVALDAYRSAAPRDDG